MKRNEQYWAEEEKVALQIVQSFSELVPIAIAVAQRMPQPVGQVAGPISTGGLGSLEKNIAVFDATIAKLITDGLTIFDLTPFEKVIFRLRQGKDTTESNQALMQEFYLPLFNSGLIKKLYFIHGWESSEGARWERQQAQRLGMEIIDLEPNLVTI